MHIRWLELGDLAFAQSIREQAGWNQTDADWRRLLAWQPNGCFLAELDGLPAGTATTTAYGRDLAWIGMVLVALDHRRRGVATALLERCLQYLRDEVRVDCIKLDATPEGEKVYGRLGFTREYELCRWVGEPQVEGVPGAFQMPEQHWLRLKVQDQEVFGCDRSGFLQRLAQDGLGAAVAVGEEGANAYAMLRSGTRADYLGPVVANDPQLANEVIGRLLTGRRRQLFWDIPEANASAIALAERLGLKRQRELIRMWTGEANVSNDPARQWGIGAPETG